MRELLRKHSRFFLIATLAGVALRLLFILRFPGITTDSFVYGDIAKNWLQRGIYGLSGLDDISPTYIRLPGYPAFLAAVFAIFGMEHYRTALVLQMFVDIGTCFLIADLARRLVSPRAARVAFLLSALCPFLANYAANALTETWEIFFTVLALDLAIVGLERLEDFSLRPWVACGFAIGAAILLRPDGALILFAIEAYLLALLLWRRKDRTPRAVSARHMLTSGLIVAAVSLATLIPWTLRNLHTFHEFQPLAPRYANQENAFVPLGFNRWMRTWIEDYVSDEDIYWNVPGNPVAVDKLPSRAFDSPQQREQTTQLLKDYNEVEHVTPELDARFAALAAERVHRSPLRYYIELPLLRIADMWLRPRTETLPSDSRWWNFDDDPEGLTLTLTLGIINLLYLAAAVAGLVRARFAPHLCLLLTFVILRSAFLVTLENPETRYTLECYPLVIILAAALFQEKDRAAIAHR
ncbi:MAG TPA: glycosyltransferase family 39 protein [Terriglobales bacterium]|nr:glycosyltransferase family 39 protein [Terriglobales bacterium]